MTSALNSTALLPRTQPEWKKALDELPAHPEKIPVFFFGHGSPMLAFPESAQGGSDPIMGHMGPKGPLATFLRDFGPALISTYKPKAIVVFSAHWETNGERLGPLNFAYHVSYFTKAQSAVTDYGDENPLLYDYFGFQPSLYQLKFKSRGDSTLSQHIVDLFKEVRMIEPMSVSINSRL